jgi:hypothetical protein
MVLVGDDFKGKSIRRERGGIVSGPSPAYSLDLSEGGWQEVATKEPACADVMTASTTPPALTPTVNGGIGVVRSF